MNTKDFTIIIPCILFSDVENCIAEKRKIYKKIKIIVCLNDSNFSTKKDKNLKFIITKSRAIGKKRNIATKYCKTKYGAAAEGHRAIKNSMFIRKIRCVFQAFCIVVHFSYWLIME